MKQKISLTEERLRRNIANKIRKILKEFIDSNTEEFDTEQIGKDFIQFIEGSDKELQYIVDCESGNQNGEPFSPIDDLIYDFEEEKDIECTPEMKKEMERAYYEWWNYAEGLLLDNDIEQKDSLTEANFFGINHNSKNYGAKPILDNFVSIHYNSINPEREQLLKEFINFIESSEKEIQYILNTDWPYVSRGVIQHFEDAKNIKFTPKIKQELSYAIYAWYKYNIDYVKECFNNK